MPVVDPDSWKVLIFGDATAWTDFLGAHALWHRALDDVIRATGASPYATLPLGDGPVGAGHDWHRVHQMTHAGEANALGIAGPIDLQTFDLKDPAQFASWCWLHAQEHILLRQDAGI